MIASGYRASFGVTIFLKLDVMVAKLSVTVLKNH